MLHEIIYVSTALRALSSDQLVSILEVSRRNNQALGVTGLLVYKQGGFFQILEGPEKEVEELYSTILQDGRHTGTVALMRGSKEQRDFPDWSMGFRELAEGEALSLPGFSRVLEQPSGYPHLQGPAATLMTEFVQGHFAAQ